MRAPSGAAVVARAQVTMATCPQCRFENDPGAASCDQCGAELDVAALSMQLGLVCRACDSYNDPGVRVCVSCGEKLVEAEEAPTDPPPSRPEEPAREPVTEPSLERQQSWLASPLTPQPFAAPALDPGTTAPKFPAIVGLSDDALPPGWSTAERRTPARIEASACGKCGASNPQSARFCGSCGAPVSGAVDKSARGKLIVIRGKTGEGRQFPLGPGSVAAGKGDVPVALQGDPYVAALHATFYFRGDELVVRDENARNGVYVRLREAAALKPGDLFVVGERLLRFSGLQPVLARSPVLHGSPVASDRLVVLEELLEGGGVGRVCRRPGPVVTIGRAACELNFPQDGYVSARHAELSVAGQTVFLRDLGSANGTFLRVQARAEKPLAHGDYLLVGRELLRVELAQAR